MLIVSLWPYEYTSDNWLELFNESSVFLCAMCYLAMTDANRSYYLKTKAGWALVGITLSSFLVNGAISLAGVLYQIYRRIRRCIEHRKQLQTLKIAALIQESKVETPREEREFNRKLAFYRQPDIARMRGFTQMFEMPSN